MVESVLFIIFSSRMRDAGCKMGRFARYYKMQDTRCKMFNILYPASCIPHPGSWILHPVSRILHPVSCIQHHLNQ